LILPLGNGASDSCAGIVMDFSIIILVSGEDSVQIVDIFAHIHDNVAPVIKRNYNIKGDSKNERDARGERAHFHLRGTRHPNRAWGIIMIRKTQI
jgi:hypothetical protein